MSVVVNIRRYLVIGLACSSVGCLIEIDYSSSSFTCETAAQECPEGLVCSQGICQPPVGLQCSAEWFNCDFSHRLPLSFDNSAGLETLVAFPALIRLNASTIDYTLTNDDGSDIRIVASDGSALAFEIERWDETSESLLWVQIPTLSEGATFSADLYFGNAAAVDAQDATAVWDANYAAVWHLADAVSASQRDSTANGNTGNASVEMEGSASSPGFIGDAISFDGVDDWIQAEHSDSLDIAADQVTLEAWVNMPQLQASDSGIVVKTVNVASTYNLQLGIQAEGNLNFRVLAGTQTYLDGASLVPLSEWHHVVGVYDGAEARVLLDNVVDGTDALTGDITVDTEPVVIGRRALGDERFFTGQIDEVRISNIARTEAWLTASYRSMSGDLLSIGSQEQRF